MNRISIFYLLLWPALLMAGTGARGQSGDSFMSPGLAAKFTEVEKERILRLAEAYWDEEPQPITNWTCDRSAGGPNDFYSEGDYWWPDPENPEGPYIRRDGLTNPEIFTAHRHAMIRMSKITGVLASAYRLTGDEKFAERAMEHLRPWFIDQTTRMNPHMLYAQAIQGRYTGRGIGIIDAMHLVEPALAIKSMEHSEAINQKELEAMTGWFGEFLDWIYTHEYGMSEMIHPNNHGTCWALQAAAFAYLSDDRDMLSLISRRYLEQLLPSQMALDGSFPLELERTKPYGYSIFNLDAMSALVQILSLSGSNLFPYTTEDGRSLRKGMEFLFPYIRNKEDWPYAEDVLHYDAYPVRQAFLLFGALAYDLPDYLEVWKTLESDPENAEVVRNTIVKNPLLWTAWDADDPKFKILTSSESPDGAEILEIPDGCWRNKGSIAFELKLSEKALHESTVLLESPVLKLTLRDHSIWPELTAAPTPEGERKERIQFAFFNPGQWYHITITWDGPGQKLQLYLNGEPQQRVIADRWTQDQFSGPLVQGGQEAEIRNVEILGGFTSDALASKLVLDLDLTPLSGEGRTLPGGTLDTGDHSLRLVYETDFTREAKMVHEDDLFRGEKRKKLPKDATWVLEGRASAEIRDGAMIVTNSADGNAIDNHAVLWNTQVFPENFLLEFDMTPGDPASGLGIIFFCATSREDGSTVFSKGLPRREGDFTRYNRGAINCYHTSYWASSAGGSRLTTNLRKNHGFELVALGDENIAASAMDHDSPKKGPFPVRLLKIDNRIELETMGERVLVWEDDGQKYGPVLGEGQIGLRQMGHAGQVSYHSFRVYEVLKQ
jgi:hypothetical protein